LNATMQSTLLQYARDPATVDLSTTGTARLGMRWVAIAAPLGAIGVFGYAILAPRILGPEFTMSVASASWIMVTCIALPLAFALSASLGVHGIFRPQPLVNALSLGTAAIGSWAWVPSYPLPGALAAVALAQLVRVAGGFCLLQFSGNARETRST